MNPLRIFCLMTMLLVSAASAKHNDIRNQLRPREWISPEELEALPSLDEITFEFLQEMPAMEGADLVNKLYHLQQLEGKMEPTYTPNMNDIPIYTFTPNGERITSKLSQLVSTVKKQPHFGEQDVTIFMTGLPENKIPDAKCANRKLIKAYLQRYNSCVALKDDMMDNEETSEENVDRMKCQKSKPSGHLVVIDLGAVIRNFEELALLDTNKVGASIGSILVQLTSQADVPQEVISIVAQGIAAHVAGAAARQYTRQTGNTLRRITAMDPSKIYARKANALIGLSRGNADFVDAIHTSAYGMGIQTRVGDIDFYPNGPSVYMPGTDDIIKSSLRATRYFAESVRPGNERNFPAVAAESLEQYKNRNGLGKRAYMGIAVDYDLKGDYILSVNAKSPFGKTAPAQKQNSYHGIHMSTDRKRMEEN